MNMRIIRTDEQAVLRTMLIHNYDEAPDEEKLPKVYRCTECGVTSDTPLPAAGHRSRARWCTGIVHVIPLPIHLGVPL